VTDQDGAPVTGLTKPPVTVTSTRTACDPRARIDAIEWYAERSGFRDLGNGFYQFNWKPAESFEGQCRTVRVSLGDGNLDHTAKFKFR